MAFLCSGILKKQTHQLWIQSFQDPSLNNFEVQLYGAGTVLKGFVLLHFKDDENVRTMHVNDKSSQPNIVKQWSVFFYFTVTFRFY